MLAIIIPYYKFTFFREALESLAAQTDQRFSVYIGNDASPENPEDLLKEFEGRFKFVYKKFEENLGETSLTKQWERCIEMMEDEEWFMILGDDDYLSKNVVAEFYENINNFADKSNVLRYESSVVNSMCEGLYGHTNNPRYESGWDSFFRKIVGKTRSSLSEYIFNKSAFEGIGFTDLDLAWGSDDLVVLEMSLDKPVFSFNNSSVMVRITNLSISGNKSNLFLKNRAALQKVQYILDNYKENLTLKQKQQLFDNLEFSVLEHSSVSEVISFVFANRFNIHFYKLNLRLMLAVFFRKNSAIIKRFKRG